ncbi:hypothetical protein KUTeg_002593 [Tegillarca granosa]|uniref:Uncharacterized protein n=1 Tax=Tegillarca granosa TaxID=220873 RepID=A0ABQ9FUU8_TEGGR|nr:hypothetical protein KUTeg_002593 [Tegillarca granosa]
MFAVFVTFYLVKDSLIKNLFPNLLIEIVCNGCVSKCISTLLDSIRSNPNFIKCGCGHNV